MNKTIIFLLISIVILVFSIICVSVSPIINDIHGNFKDWGKGNCRYYADIAKYTNSLDAKYKNERLMNLCYRQNAMSDLEYSSFIIDLAIGFIGAQLSLLHYFKFGISFEKYTGLIGLVGGAIGFIITLVYVCFSGYIFVNDVAYKDLEGNNLYLLVTKLYSNGAKYKGTSANPIYVYSNDKSYEPEYAKYKDLGLSQYNYNKKLYESYYRNPTNCAVGSTDSCEYYYGTPIEDYKNKYLYDRWCLSLVLAVFISALNIVLLIFGLLIFKDKDGSPNDIQEVKIEY